MSERIEGQARLADSELRAWILTAEIFNPGQFNLGQSVELFVIRIEALRAWEDEAILLEVELMRKEGLVRKENGTYRSTYEGQVARERLLQAQGRRAACLLHQHNCDVQDLVLALVVAPQIMGFVHEAEAEARLKVYLHARVPELRAAANALIERGYMTAVENLGFSEESPGYYPSGKGMRRYDEFVRERLGIAKNTSILDPSAFADEEPGTTPNSDLAIADSVLSIGEDVISGEETYRILAQVGAGGMGRVYSAERPDGRRVALKILSSTRFEIGTTERERFRREARIARDVDHLNLVRAFDVLEHRGLLVTVMELLPGENLEVRLKKGRPAIDVGTRWMLELAAGLGELHKKRIVHRDISAKNALLRADDTLAISDFGIARPVDDPTLTVGPGVFGSLIYISPQQRENPHDATFADDVFSLGQLFFYIVTGMNPHNTGALSQHTHVYEQRVADLIESMRHHDRTKRPVDGNDVRFRLEACVKERPTRRSGAAVPGSPAVARLRAAATTSLSAEAERIRKEEHRAKVLREQMRSIAEMVETAAISAFREAHEAIAETATHVSLAERNLSTAYVGEPDLPTLSSPLVSLTFKGSNRSIDLYRAHEGIDKWDSSVSARARDLTTNRTMLYPAWMVHEAGVTPWRTHGILLASSTPDDPLSDAFEIEVCGENAGSNAGTLRSPLDIKNHIFGLLENALISPTNVIAEASDKEPRNERPEPEPVPAMTEAAPLTPDRLLVLLANQGNGTSIGHVRFGRDDLRALVRVQELELTDVIEALESRGLVHAEWSLGNSLPLEMRLTHTGREAAYKQGVLLPSPVSDADELRQQMRRASPRGELSGSQLANLAGWPVERAIDAARVLVDRGHAQVRQKSAPDGFRAELTAEGRLAT